MSISVSAQAQYLYNSYTFNNSSTYSENAVDTSSVSKEKYNISNLTNALDAMSKTDSVDISSISNLITYVQNTYKLSQMGSYQTLSTESSGIVRMLTGEASANDIYSLLETESEIEANTALSAASSSSNTAASAYAEYLSESGSMLNLLV